MKETEKLLSDYSDFVYNLRNPKISKDIIMVYLTTKLLNESIELLLSNKKEDFIDEAGDCTWYFFNIAKELHINLFFHLNFDLRLIDYNLIEFVNSLNQMYIKNYFHDKPLDNDNIINKFLFSWYCFLMHLNHIKVDLGSVLEYNMDKLRKRHGETYKKEFYQQK